MNAPLSRFLVQFSDYKHEEAIEEPALDPIDDVALEPEPIEPTVTMTAEAFEQALRESREIAAAEERIVMEAQADLRLEEQRAALTGEFDAAREAWAHEEGQAIASSLAAALATIEGALADGVANALRPLLTEACRAKVLSEMRTALAAILADPSNPPVRIEGPADLLTAFGNAQPDNIAIDYVVSDHTELTIITDGTRIESRLSKCLSTLQITEGA